MKNARNLPEIPVVLPMLRGFGLDDVSGPLVKRLETTSGVRVIGRLLGDATLPWTLGIGWGITVAPSIIQDARSGAPWHRFVADFVIDSVGFWGSEAAGWFVAVPIGLGTRNPVIAFGAKFAFDVAIGVRWDMFVEENHLRPRLSQWIKKLVSSEN